MKLQKPELLLPAGSLDRLKTAFLYGADAVYAGMPGVSLRNKTSFTLAEMKQGIDYAHTLGKKVYLTINLFTHDADLPRLGEFVSHLSDLNPDGVIVADPGVFSYVQKRLPDLPLHISTQANVCSSLTVGFWRDQGAALCVLGREVSLSELSQIRKNCPDIRLEIFAHGALCVSYSGRCLLSNFMTGRSANKGNCAHSCRWKYKLYETGTDPQTGAEKKFYLEEETRPMELMQIDEDTHGTYIMNSKDLCLLPRLNEILPVGLDSFKIEGRNKSEYYAAITARAYRHAIDDWFDNPENWNADKYMREVMTLQSRGYTVGFLDGNAGPDAQNYNVSASTGKWRYAGLVRSVKSDRVVMEVKHKITKGMMLEFLSPAQFDPIQITVQDFYDEKSGKLIDEMSSGRLGQSIEIPLSSAQVQALQPLSVVRTFLGR
ncbi:MAG: U32 family peptidase C-terminal domain-containing protein [Lactobacillales bacterium]|jgi:putative protease|nr:U32 family peptidase C-terminal domain-containing protein [Lactobacillales bacterium]